MWEDYQAQMTGILFVVLCLLPVSAKECYFPASFISWREELFNASNYRHVCLGDVNGYDKQVVYCGAHLINPKCICALEMYQKDIFDLCKNTGAESGNGSIEHVTDEFCKNYSYDGSGPCQNGGKLIINKDLAIDAKCECRKGYYGEFCDTEKKNIVCISTYLQLGFKNCSQTFRPSPSNPYCLLSLEAGKTHRFLCDANTTATDKMEACSSAPEKFRGDSSKGLTIHTPDIVFIFTTLLLLIPKSLIV